MTTNEITSNQIYGKLNFTKIDNKIYEKFETLGIPTPFF